MIQNERVSGKGKLTRKRTVRDSAADDSAAQDAAQNSVPATATTEYSTRPDDSTARGGREGTSLLNPTIAGRDVDGRVLSVHGLNSRVLGSDGRTYECTIRQVLKSLFTDARHAVVAGDRVRIRPEADRRGTIESVQPRHGVINRTSRGRQHIIAANVDYLMVITSAAEPGMKPALVDRYLLTAEQCRVKPIVVINKADLVDPIDLQQAMGVYAALGYRVVMTSAQSGMNIQYLKALLAGKQTVLSGQSGVGKSSLLNAIEPGLGLAVATVSKENDKGRHTTTASRLIPIGPQGAVFDTPGIRQFQLWDIDSGEVAGLMPDLRPFVSHCRYPNCLHLSEDGCAVKNAVADAQIDARRYDAYCHLVEDELLPAESSRH